MVASAIRVMNINRFPIQDRNVGAIKKHVTCLRGVDMQLAEDLK